MRFINLEPGQDRAIHELQQGRPIQLSEGNDWWACQAIDSLTLPEPVIGGYALISGPRAAMLGLGDPNIPRAIPIGKHADKGVMQFIMGSNVKISVPSKPAPNFAKPLINLAKQGRLIPAFYLWPLSSADNSLISLRSDELPLSDSIAELRRLSTVDLPLEIAGHRLNTQALLFDHPGGQQELLALTLGDPRPTDVPLVRLHSSCLTGDVFGSLRCDCGPQLHQALNSIQEAGQGCLLYLPQEGRDTGLRNKLRAYALQDAGLDTIDADATLGFEADERDFAMAAALLKHMGLSSIRLMTNNPQKVLGLEAEGIQVVDRVPLEIEPHTHNHEYLKTKAHRAGHDLAHPKLR